MRINIQLIQNHVLNKESGLVLSIDNQQYLFNVSESYQRYIKEHNLRFSVETRIFISRLDTFKVSGLFGLMLTMVQHKASLGTKVYGPSGITDFFKQALFLFWHNMLPFSIADLTEPSQIMHGVSNQSLIDNIVNDPTINESHLYYAAIRKIGEENKQNINDASSSIEEGNTGKIYQDEHCKVSSVVCKWADRECISYLIETRQHLGKVQLDKCKARGVIKNQIGQVMRGEAVWANEQWVQAQDLVDQVHPGQIILVLDCPSLQVMDQLKQFKEEGTLFPKDVDLHCVVHLDSSLLNQPLFQSFIDSFPSQVTHYYSPINQPLQSESLYRHTRFQYELSSIFPTVFQTPFYLQPNQQPNQIMNMKMKMSEKFYENQLWPQKNSGYQIIKKNKEHLENNIIETDDFKRRMIKYESLGGQKEIKDERRVIFTGTGSMIPSTFRNVSGILTEFTHMSIMMDCGEGTFNQLADSYNSHSAFLASLQKIKVIFLTHIHCDHTLGSAPFILRRKEFLEQYASYVPERDELFLIYSYNTHAWFKTYQKYIETIPCRIVFTQQLVPIEEQAPIEEPGLFYTMSKSAIYTHDDLEQLCGDHQSHSNGHLEALQELLKKSHISLLRAIAVDHCPQSYALAVEESLPQQKAFKLCYSGDTRPCEGLQKQTKGYDVLIHECTYNDDKQMNAVSHQHTAVSEAIQIAIQNKIQWLYLTHFSQRYIKGFLHTPTNPQFKQYYLHNTLIASDNMHVHSNNIQQAVYIKNVLKEISTP